MLQVFINEFKLSHEILFHSTKPQFISTLVVTSHESKTFFHVYILCVQLITWT